MLMIRPPAETSLGWSVPPQPSEQLFCAPPQYLAFSVAVLPGLSLFQRCVHFAQRGQTRFRVTLASSTLLSPSSDGSGPTSLPDSRARTVAGAPP